MRKANEQQPASCISVTISRFGHDPKFLSLSEGTTVDQALAQAGIPVEGNQQLMVDGQRAEGGDVLEHGDVLSVVTPKQAG